MLTLGIATVDHIQLRLLQHLQHARKFFGRILRIVIQDSDTSTATVCQSRQHGIVFTKVARQAYEENVGLVSAEAFTLRRAGINGAIINENDFDGTVDECTLHSVYDTPNAQRTVENRNHHRDIDFDGRIVRGLDHLRRASSTT